MSVQYYERSNFIPSMARFFRPVDSLVDIGCGVRPQTAIKTKIHIAIEPHKPYLDALKPYCPTDSQYIFINTDGLSGLKMFADKSVDSVCMVDLIEHLEKDAGYELLRESERVARYQLIVFTPLGFFPQDYHEGDRDAWNMDGASYQVHKSGWMPDDFGPGWDFHICERFHLQSVCHFPIDRDYGCFYAFKNMDFQGYDIPANVPPFVVDCASPGRVLKPKSDPRRNYDQQYQMWL